MKRISLVFVLLSACQVLPGVPSDSAVPVATTLVLVEAPTDLAAGAIAGLRWVRYVDDVLVFGSRQDLIEQRKVLDSKLTALRLRQHPHKTRIQPTTEPLKFLGLILEQTGRVRPPGRSIRRWKVVQGKGLLMRSRSPMA